MAHSERTYVVRVDGIARVSNHYRVKASTAEQAREVARLSAKTDTEWQFHGLREDMDTVIIDPDSGGEVLWEPEGP